MTRPLRIVHAIRSDGFAGVERHVAVLARAQAAHGQHVTVIGGNAQRMPLVLQGQPVEFRPGESVWRVTRAVARAARGADLVHAHMTAAEFASVLASLPPGPRVPIVVTRHFASPRGQSRLGRPAARIIAQRIDGQIAISRYVADRVDGSSETVYPGVETLEADEGPREPVVLVVQRLEPEKRTDVAVEAFARSGLAARGWRLRVAGDGSLRGNLERLTDELGIAGAVDFLGARTDVARLMLGAALLLAPCPVEGLGLGVLEAMAALLPVVASRAGGHLETLPRQAHDHCFPANDPDAAADAINRLAADAELRHELASAGVERQRAFFTPAVQAVRTAAVYEAVLAARGR